MGVYQFDRTWKSLNIFWKSHNRKVHNFFSMMPELETRTYFLYYFMPFQKGDNPTSDLLHNFKNRELKCCYPKLCCGYSKEQFQ